jgi:hypothetical protein
MRSCQVAFQANQERASVRRCEEAASYVTAPFPLFRRTSRFYERLIWFLVVVRFVHPRLPKVS